MGITLIIKTSSLHKKEYLESVETNEMFNN